MKIKVNGKEKEIDADTLSIKELLDVSSVEKPEMVSVQLNGDFVKKESYTTAKVKDGDEVDFLYFMGGGTLNY